MKEKMQKKNMNFQWKSLLIGMFICLNTSMVPLVCAATVSSPVIVGKSIDINNIIRRSSNLTSLNLNTTTRIPDFQLDASLILLPPLTQGGVPRWIGSYFNKGVDGGIFHVITEGSVDKPFSSLEGTIRGTCLRAPANLTMCKTLKTNEPISPENYAFTEFSEGVHGVAELWIMGVYKTKEDKDTLLAFVHEEPARKTTLAQITDPTGNSSDAIGGKNRIGLAWSTNSGKNWKYLGRIIAPSNGNELHNLQGVPYVIKDNDFYVYFNDAPGHMTAAKASISNVIAAAQKGNVGINLWKKFNGKEFTNDALTGNSVGVGPNEVNHTQATQVNFNNTSAYYLLTTSQSVAGGATFVRLSESTDLTHWSPTIVGSEGNGLVANEANSTQVHDHSDPTAPYDGGFQYCSITDNLGVASGTAIVGSKFYIFCQKESDKATSKFALYRWEINIDPRNKNNFFRQSTDFQSVVAGSKWAYQYGGSGPIFNMSWNSGGYWRGTEEFTRIYKDSMHPGQGEIPILKWIAPREGNVSIDGTIRMSNLTCGDGVNATISYSGTNTTIFSTSTAKATDGGSGLAFNDNLGLSHRLSQKVSAGQALFFMVSPKTNNYCDSIVWDPSVTYQD